MHSRFCFRSDLIKFLKENGKLPPFRLDEVATMMERERELVQTKEEMIKEKEVMSRENAKLIEEIKMLRADHSRCCQLF